MGEAGPKGTLGLPGWTPENKPSLVSVVWIYVSTTLRNMLAGENWYPLFPRIMVPRIRFMWDCPWRLEWKTPHQYWDRTQVGPFYYLHLRLQEYDDSGVWK